MITKQDCIILLTDIGATDKIKEVIKQENPSIEIIKFINDNKENTINKAPDIAFHICGHKSFKHLFALPFKCFSCIIFLLATGIT